MLFRSITPEHDPGAIWALPQGLSTDGSQCQRTHCRRGCSSGTVGRHIRNDLRSAGDRGPSIYRSVGKGSSGEVLKERPWTCRTVRPGDRHLRRRREYFSRIRLRNASGYHRQAESRARRAAWVDHVDDLKRGTRRRRHGSLPPRRQDGASKQHGSGRSGTREACEGATGQNRRRRADASGRHRSGEGEWSHRGGSGLRAGRRTEQNEKGRDLFHRSSRR